MLCNNDLPTGVWIPGGTQRLVQVIPAQMDSVSKSQFLDPLLLEVPFAKIGERHLKAIILNPNPWM